MSLRSSNPPANACHSTLPLSRHAWQWRAGYFKIEINQEQLGHPSFTSLHFFGVGSCMVPMLRRGNPYGMHSHAGTWKRKIKLLAIFLSE